VTFHPDGTVTLKAKWVSNSTAAFIQEVTGLGACVHDHSVRIFLAEGAYRIPTEGLKIRRKNGEGPWELVVKQVNIVHHIRRREANNVRRKPEYAAFRDYLSGVIKIKEKMFDEDECKELFGVKVHEYKTSGGETLQWQIPDVPKLYYHDRDSMQALFRMANSGDPVQMYKAVVIIAKKTCGYILNLNDILVAWDRCIIAYHKDEVLVEVELPAGALRRDQYGWAFR
jgi:hypothetical protein